jgi:hypothetical protein
MKRHHQLPGKNLRLLTRSGLWAILTSGALAQLSACGSLPQEHAKLDGIRDNASLLLVENSFLMEEDEHPTIPGSTLYYILMSDPKATKPRAYAIDCRGKNIAELAAAFGVDPSTPYPGSDSFRTLDENYNISEQPILRCSSVHPTGQNTFVHTVFQLVDDRPEDKKKEKPLPQLLVRFNNVTADDTVDQDQFYSIGCRDILNSFGTNEQKSLAKSTPILASSAASIFPGFGDFRPLNCTTNTQDPLLNKAPKKVEDLPIRTSQDASQKNLEFYRVVDVLNTQKTLSYLIGQGNDFTRVLCYNITDAEIKAALNFPSSHVTQDIKSDDARYINARNRPELECVNLQTRDRFESRWTTVREAPAVNYYKRKNAQTLYRFGCSSAESYFTSGLNLASSPIQVTPDLIDYLALTPSTGYKVVTFPCYGAGLTPDPKALQAGEVISLKLPSAPASKAWLDAHTGTSAVYQTEKQASGSHWLVTSAGEGAYHLQSLGETPSLSYLACPVSGHAPQLVKTSDAHGFQTKWVAYRGEGASTMRLGCSDANGKVRLLNGGGSATVLSDESTSLSPDTNWWIQHHTFVEDSNLLRPGQIVSFYSLLTNQDNRWIAGYPGGKFDIGLEPNNTSAATYFQVESRKDSRGVALKSLNHGTGDRYIDCKTDSDKRWLELAPVTDGVYVGTAFKAYKLSNSSFPIFKLACFNANNDPHWVSVSGEFPWLLTGMPANLSSPHSIMFLQTRPGAPAAPGAKPRQEKIPRIDFKLENKCTSDLEVALLSFDTEWTTKVVTIKSKKTHTVQVQNQYTYYLPNMNFGGTKSEVQILYKGTWQKSFEFNHNYRKKADGSASWTNQITFCT